MSRFVGNGYQADVGVGMSYSRGPASESTWLRKSEDVSGRDKRRGMRMVGIRVQVQFTGTCIVHSQANRGAEGGNVHTCIRGNKKCNVPDTPQSEPRSDDYGIGRLET